MLTKSLKRTYIPPVAGTPAVEYQPAGVYCRPVRDGGYWRIDQVVLPASFASGSRTRIPETAVVAYTYREGVLMVIIPRAVWVPDPAPAAPVCTSYPEVLAKPAVPAAPGRTETSVLQQWGDAGANSVTSQDADCVCTFTMGRVGGAVIGLTHNTDDPGDRTRMSHALYFRTAGSALRFSVMESGIGRTVEQEYSAGDEFKVMRAGTGVSYWHNGSRVYASQVPSTGTLRVGCSLFASGDKIE